MENKIHVTFPRELCAKSTSKETREKIITNDFLEKNIH